MFFFLASVECHVSILYRSRGFVEIPRGLRRPGRNPILFLKKKNQLKSEDCDDDRGRRRRQDPCVALSISLRNSEQRPRGCDGRGTSCKVYPEVGEDEALRMRQRGADPSCYHHFTLPKNLAVGPVLGPTYKSPHQENDTWLNTLLLCLST